MCCCGAPSPASDFLVFVAYCCCTHAHGHAFVLLVRTLTFRLKRCFSWNSGSTASHVMMQVEIMMALEEKFEIQLDEEGKAVAQHHIPAPDACI